MDHENFVRYHRCLTDLHSTQMSNFLMYEMSLKYVTCIEVARRESKQMDCENFERYYRRLTELPSTQMLNFLMYEMPLKYVTSIQVTRTVDTEMDIENFVQYHRRLTDLHTHKQKKIGTICLFPNETAFFKWAWWIVKVLSRPMSLLIPIRLN